MDWTKDDQIKYKETFILFLLNIWMISALKFYFKLSFSR